MFRYHPAIMAAAVLALALAAAGCTSAAPAATVTASPPPGCPGATLAMIAAAAQITARNTTQAAQELSSYAQSLPDGTAIKVDVYEAAFSVDRYGLDTRQGQPVDQDIAAMSQAFTTVARYCAGT
jgi:hypothetical protein